MSFQSNLRNINPPQSSGQYQAAQVVAGITVPAVRRVQLFSSVEWEEFTEEWATSLKDQYGMVQRLSGPGDKGCDVVCFVDAAKKFDKAWDNYQCKHYDHSLYPSDIWVELGKVIYYSYSGEYSAPSKYYFVAPQGIGTSLYRLLSSPSELKNGLLANWQKHCENKITDTGKIPLDDALSKYISTFNFSIFDSKSIAELIEGHARTPFHATRFGGGLPGRPAVELPPSAMSSQESRYIQQLFEAYSDHLKITILNLESFQDNSGLVQHFRRQRELFYHAESLKSYARDTVPLGTVESLQDEVYHGVVDLCENDHQDGLARAKATISQAAQISLQANALSHVTSVQDKQGICHQLANDDRLKWVKS